MKLIAAADLRWGIGRGGALLVSIPADLRHFRELTMGGTVILGRKTLATFPGGKPLPGRKNIILSTDPHFSAGDALVAHSVEEALALAGKEQENVWVIGGASIYRAFLPYCDEAVITKIEMQYDADAFMPDLDRDPAWVKTEESEEMTCFDIVYRFVTYRRLGARC